MSLVQRGSMLLRQLCCWLGWREGFPVTVVLLALIGAATAYGADTVPTSSPDLHTFTNQEGKTINAVILSVAQDDVNLKRDDGQSFKVAVSTLSKEDQVFIRLWVIQQAQAHHEDVLTISAASVRTDAKPVPSTNKISVTSQWTEGYKVKVTNETPVHWANLHLRYVIFRQAGVPGAMPPSNYTPTHSTGTAAIDDLPGQQDVTVSTDKIDLLEVSTAPGYSYSNGAPVKVTDQIQGIWLRVYDDGNNLLQEWSSSKEITKDISWDALWAPVARGRRGAGNARGAAPARGN